MTTLEEAQAKLALATIKLEKLHDDYQTVNPDAIYWLLRMKEPRQPYERLATSS